MSIPSPIYKSYDKEHFTHVKGVTLQDMLG